MVFNLVTRSINVSRNVIFYENCFPYTKDQTRENDISITSLPSLPVYKSFGHYEVETNFEDAFDQSIAEECNTNEENNTHFVSKKCYVQSDSIHTPLKRITRTRQQLVYMKNYQVTINYANTKKGLR